jgi:hypothetical protein
MVVDIVEGLTLDPFAILSLLLALISVGSVVVLAFRGASQTRELRDFVAGALERAQQAVDSANPGAVRGLLEEFEHAIVIRIQKTERGFVDLGEEMTDALDKAQRLDRSASAKRSRARAIERKNDEREGEEIEGAAGGDPFSNPALSRDQKLDLARKSLASRGIAT